MNAYIGRLLRPSRPEKLKSGLIISVRDRPAIQQEVLCVPLHSYWIPKVAWKGIQIVARLHAMRVSVSLSLSRSLARSLSLSLSLALSPGRSWESILISIESIGALKLSKAVVIKKCKGSLPDTPSLDALHHLGNGHLNPMTSTLISERLPEVSSTKPTRQRIPRAPYDELLASETASSTCATVHQLIPVGNNILGRFLK